MGYTKDTIKGFSWMGGLRIVTKFVALLKIAILARLLTPFQFGVFGIAALILSFFETVSQTGLAIILVQEKRQMLKYLNSAYIISIFRGFVLGLVIYISAPLAAAYFNSVESEDLIRLVSLIAVVRGFINPARVSYLKELEFAKEFWFSLIVFSVDTTVSITMVIILQSPIGLVWGLVAGAVIEMFLSLIFISPKPKIVLEWRKVIELLRRGKWITESNIFTYFFDQGGDIFVGRLLNTHILGIYQAAYKVSITPITEVVKVVNQVTFPVYAQISDDRNRLKMAFVKTLFTVLGLIIPIALFFYMFSTEITLLIFGDQWLAVVPLIKMLSIFAVLKGIIISLNPLFNALGRQDIIAKLSLVGLIVMILVIVPFIQNYGPLGVGYTMAIAALATLPFIHYYLKKVLS